MIARPEPARVLLPSLILVVGAALPAGTAAQTAPPPAETSWLSASMSEARRSPFHSPATVPGPALLGSVPVPAPVNEGLQLADSANDPSFLKVFLWTLPVTAAADYAGLRGLACARGCGGWESFFQIFGLPILFLAPPAAATLAGGSFGTALLGSTLGVLPSLLGGLASYEVIDSDWGLIVVPFLRAGIMTTWMSLRGQ